MSLNYKENTFWRAKLLFPSLYRPQQTEISDPEKKP